MNLFKYNRKEAMKNNCYDKMAIEPRKTFIIRCIIPGIILLLLVICSPFIIPFMLPDFITTLLIIAILIGYPICYALMYIKNNNWFVTAFIKDENNEIWYIE